MSQWDVRSLETIFEGFRNDRYPSLAISEAFERFVARQALKNEDLSDDEIESGMTGGDDDGGVDGLYFFVNRGLVQDESDLPDEAISASLIIMQAKLEKGFAETAVQKLEDFARDLLDYNRAISSLIHLNADLRDAIGRFRDNYMKIIGASHTMSVTFVYGTKSDTAPHPKVVKRAEDLKKYVQDQLSNAHVDVEFWGAQKLTAVARQSPTTTETLDITKQFTTDDDSAICLVRLGSLAKLLRGNDGEIRRPILEPNVRDYQGSKNLVNKGIRETLEGENGVTEFWWLNNGVTLLAKNCHVAGNKLVVEKPEVVNGLQTSHEIFRFFKDTPEKADSRNVLIRVIVPPDEQTRTKIIRATNSQTPISDLSLRATDPIHFEIEEKFRLFGLFYERRRAEYRELKKPADQIISIQTLGRAIIAIYLHEPNNAYATPSRVLKKSESYDKIFSPTNDRDMFVACMLLQRQVEKYLEGFPALKNVRSILRYYVSMASACLLLKRRARPSPKDLAGLLPLIQKQVDDTVLSEATALTTKAFEKHGKTETAAKGPNMLTDLLDEVEMSLASPGQLV